MRRRMGDVQRELRLVWNTTWDQWQKMHGMEFHIGMLTREGQEDCCEILAAKSCITSLETRLEAQQAVNQELRECLEKFEETQEEIVHKLASLDLD